MWAEVGPGRLAVGCRQSGCGPGSAGVGTGSVSHGPEVRLPSSAYSSDTAAAALRQVGDVNTEGQRRGSLVRPQSMLKI